MARPLGDPGPRTGKELFRATTAFAQEDRFLSWWHLGSAIAMVAGCLLAAALVPWWPLRVVAALAGALLMVRLFILYHDFMHGAILRGSRVATAVFSCLGILFMTPPRSWRQSHNFHHGHTGRVSETNIGSFPLLSTEMWRAASPGRRLAYRLSRSPLIILFAWVTVFLYSICWSAFASDPRKHWDSALAIAVNVGIIVALWLLAGPAVLFFAFVLPLFTSSALGAYLFYAQHNVADMRILDAEDWNYHEAALASSSYLKLGPIMRRVTGNIGYHHVHHLNPLIPFYRLPEAMAAIPELQTPAVTTLHPRDVIASLRLKLWDRASERMVGFREAGELPVAGS